MPSNPRHIAARILTLVIHKGTSLDQALTESSSVPDADAPLVREIAYGVLRHYYCLSGIRTQLLKRPLKEKDADIGALILVGLYQMLYMRTPPHAAVSETVSAVNAMKKPWAKGLINGVLRNFQRNRQTLLDKARRNPAAATDHPKWLRQRFYRAWQNDFRQVIQSGNQRAPMSLRINLDRISADTFLGMLNEQKIEARLDSHLPCAIELASPVDVGRLPGFTRGHVSVQDKAAQQAVLLLDPQPGQRILDACAAPGGKTGHILELVNGEADLLALDIKAERLARVAENLDRLGYKASLKTGDAATPDEWWDGKLFDRILIDAPCSGTGVIRRHPDIKLLRRPQDINNLASIQASILSSLWKLLAPGGKLVYATCSILPVENQRQIEAFLRQHGDAKEMTTRAPAYGRYCGPGWQVLTGEQGLDGFYYACMEKI